MIRLALAGVRGRMCGRVLELARTLQDMRVSLGIDRADRDAAEAQRLGIERIVAVERAGPALAAVDVVIDFSTAAATRALLDAAGAALHGRALVVGTTGLEPATERLLDELAAHSAVLTAANFSPGVNLLLALAERVAAVLGEQEYDIEVVEAHHGRKLDAPSGTALALAGAAARGRARELTDVRRDGRSGAVGARTAGEIGLHAVRGGGVVGEHRVMFLGERERIELTHEALDRALFAHGALAAARWIADRPPGRYTMRDVLNL